MDGIIFFLTMGAEEICPDTTASLVLRDEGRPGNITTRTSRTFTQFLKCFGALLSSDFPHNSSFLAHRRRCNLSITDMLNCHHKFHGCLCLMKILVFYQKFEHGQDSISCTHHKEKETHFGLCFTSFLYTC